MADDEIIDAVLDGRSVRIFLRPNPKRDTVQPEYIETYALPHVIVSGKHFWASAQRNHLPHVFGEKRNPVCGFTYTNGAFCFLTTYYESFAAISADKSIQVLFQSRHQYLEHRWILKNNFEPIWDSAAGISPEVVVGPIRSGRKFKVVFEDEEGVWNAHPVDLPFFYSQTRTFKLQTHIDFFPYFFREPNAGDTIERSFPSLRDETRGGENISTTTSAFCSYYCLSSDGTYYTLDDIKTGTLRPYKRLKVFAERE